MTKNQSSTESERAVAFSDLGIVLVYTAFAAAWIVFSDRAVNAVFTTPEGISLAGTLKGWLFVAVTSLLLYGLLRRRAAYFHGAMAPAFPEGLVRWPRWALYAFAVTASAAMLLIRMQIAVEFDDRPMLVILMFPVILSALLGGFGPGLLSTLIVSVGVAYAAMTPIHGFNGVHRYELIQWAFLIVDGVLVSILAELMRRSWGGANTALVERLRALKLLETLSDSSNDAIFAKDLDGRFILFNRAAAEFVGKSVEDVLGHDERAIFPAEQAQMLMEAERRVVAENRTETNEEILDTPHGTLIFLTTKGPLRDADGRVIGTFGISRDITERKRAETALRESEQRYHSLFDNMLNGVVHCRMIFENGVPVDYEYLSANPAFGEVTGIRENVVGRRISEVLPGYCRDNPESLETFGRVAQTGEPARWEHYLAALDRWFSFVIYSPARGEVVIVTENITERKKVEQALRDSEERFHQIFDNISSGVAVYRAVDDGKDFVFLEFNRAAEGIENISRQDLLGKRVTQVFPGVAEFGLLDVMRRVWHTGMAENHPVTHYQDERIAGWRENYICRLPSGEVVAIYDDITESKRAEASLIASEHRFHDIVEASADWVWEVDAEGRYTYVSESVVNLLGYAPPEVLGKTPFDFMPPAEAERVRAVFAAIAARRDPFRDLDNVNLHKDGSLRHVWSNGMPILNADGKLLGYRGLDRDITERKLTELALRESEARFRALFENSLDGVLLTKPDGSILTANPEAEHIFGHSEEELRRLGRASVVDPSDPRLAPALAERERTGRFHGELTLIRKGGIRFSAELSSLEFVDEHGERMTSMFVKDISERKAAEEALRSRNQELERFNRAMVGRELDMLELKRQINALSGELGREPPFRLDFAAEPAQHGDETS